MTTGQIVAVKVLGVLAMIDSKETGLTAVVEGGEDEAVNQVLGAFPRPWKRP